MAKKYKHNRAGIREAALRSWRVRDVVGSTTARVESAALALGASDAQMSMHGKSRPRGYVSRRSAAAEAKDGVLNRALRQAAGGQ